MKNIEQNNEASFDLSVSIVNYNVTNLVIDLIDSIYKSEYAKNHNLEILAVDNNSDDHGDRIIHRYPEVKLIKNKKNVFFTKADNQNLKRSKGKFILSVNPDVTFKPSAIGKLVEFLENNENVGAVAPKIIFPDGKLQSTIGRFVTKKFGILSVLGIKNNFFNTDDWFNTSSEPFSGEILYGACILTTRETLNQVGLKDDNLVHGWDEYDWCKRITDSGKTLFCVPSAIAIHQRNVSARKMFSTEKGKSLMNKLHWNGFFYLYKKHYSRPFYLLLIIIYYLTFPFRLANGQLRKILP